MEGKLQEWVIVCYFALIFAGVVGILGGILLDDKTGLAVALLIALGVGYYAVRRGQKRDYD